MKIDFVSDVACPWCAVGLNGLEEALARTGDLIDATITFHALTNDEIRSIAMLLIKRVQEQLKDHGLTLDIRDDAYDLLAKRGYDPAFGARPLRRIITNLIEDPLSEGVLEARFHIGDVVVVDVATLESGETYLRLRPAREVNDEVEEEEGAIA